MVANIADGKFYFLKDPTGLEQIVLRDVMEHTGTTWRWRSRSRLKWPYRPRSSMG